MALLSGRETVILPFARSGNEPIIYQTVPTLFGFKFNPK
jgi:hypothetical protein